MGAFRLTPADAAHLAFAGNHAHTFITADGDYGTVSGPNAPVNLDMLHVT
jgi:predicted nucleic acid-binding protein